MAYPAIQLINEAYFLAAIVGKGFNSATDDQINEGLKLLNDILNEKSVDTELNPYFQQYTFNTIAQKEDYFIPNLISTETMTFVLNTVRYVSDSYSRTEYWNTYRANTINTLPLGYTCERKLGGATLYFYPLPNEVYPVSFWGQFFLTNITSLQQDLSLAYDGFYISFLKFALAARLCMFYGKQVPQYTAMQLASLELQFSKQISGPDLTNTKVSTLSGGDSINYAWINLSGGFIPGTGGV